MKIFIGADHNGYELKEKIEEWLKSAGHEVEDVGNQKLDPEDDFPMFGARVATHVLAEPEARGILLCGSGQGVCMAANRYKGIRASLVWNESEAKASRNDDDANVLCLPARETTDKNALKRLVEVWLKTPFSGAVRFQRRIKQLDEL